MSKYGSFPHAYKNIAHSNISHPCPLIANKNLNNQLTFDDTVYMGHV